MSSGSEDKKDEKPEQTNDDIVETQLNSDKSGEIINNQVILTDLKIIITIIIIIILIINQQT